MTSSDGNFYHLKQPGVHTMIMIPLLLSMLLLLCWLISLGGAFNATTACNYHHAIPRYMWTAKLELVYCKLQAPSDLEQLLHYCVV